ncbi:hypothetical protein K435DRAFT_843608 [Dendrothele bispora CBS 962.96]|uniref:Galactose oxidase n=1 Tax=Dendrothele bispora (strain CBS 962.96) TaxID=1314807 RepID=A0A4S8L7B0_DENBC|nr:hypothetical protein K435DRAFT_843608 [Dendrothele bispora CBS 962.96]
MPFWKELYPLAEDDPWASPSTSDPSSPPSTPKTPMADFIRDIEENKSAEKKAAKLVAEKTSKRVHVLSFFKSHSAVGIFFAYIRRLAKFRNVLAGQKLGKYVVPEDEADVQLGEDLNLRKRNAVLSSTRNMPGKDSTGSKWTSCIVLVNFFFKWRNKILSICQLAKVWQKFASNLDTTVFDLEFPPTLNYEAIIPIRGVPTAVDHEDQKLYILTYHNDDDGTEPGTVIHCLDLKTKVWDGSLHKIKSTHSFDNSPGHYLPPCVFTTLTFIKHRNGKKYLFIVGGYFGDPDAYSAGNDRYQHLNDDMNILVIDIVGKSWDVLHVFGKAPRRYGHAVVNIEDTVYIFGGRKDMPDNIHSGDWNRLCPLDQLLESYSILTFNDTSGQWIWSTPDKPFPKTRVKSIMGYLNQAAVIERGTKKHILLTPGESGNGESCDLVPKNFALYNPANDTFMCWDEHSFDDPRNIAYHELRSYPSPKHSKGISDSIVFAIPDEGGAEVKFYHYRPAENDGIHVVGTLKNVITRGSVGNKTQKPGTLKTFIGFETVGSDMYVLAKDEEDLVDTVIHVKFLGIDS